MLKSLRYFFYLAWNWNPVLAAFVVWHEWNGERKLGIDTTGIDQLEDLEATGVDIQHASMYMPMNYFILNRLLEEKGNPQPGDGFLDLGCGKGRVLVAAAACGYQQVYGVDFHPKLCQIAREATGEATLRYPKTTFTVFNNDAFYFDIPTGVSTIFLFNPFDAVIMRGVINNILGSQRLNPRKIKILYANPVHKTLFLNEGFCETYHIKTMGYLEGSILERG